MPAVSEAQRRYLFAKFGAAWVRRHHFDNKGSLPAHAHDPRKGAAMASNMQVGGGGRFAKLEASIAARGNVKDPAAIAAMVGRRKYGKKRFAAMAAAGRKRA